MEHSVGKYQIIDIQSHVIANDLIKYLLINHHIRGFTLNDQQRFSKVIVNNDISSFFSFIKFKPSLNSHQRSRILLFANEEFDKVLAHPFFRSKCDKPLSGFIEYLFPVI